MRVLVVGAGGREHALCWALARSPLLSKLWCAPGNPGTAEVAENVPIGVLDLYALVHFAQANKVDLVVPGGEPSLVAGITDAMDVAGIACCGPSAAAAQLEGSKFFTKEVCEAASIPTAAWERFDDAAAAREFVRRRGAPIVVKADGLAAGKGVVVAATVAEAEEAIRDFMEEGRLGAAGATVVIEECLVGEEVSLFALCDGRHAIVLGAAQDHKRVGDGDTGPNTGGMGTYSPTPVLTEALIEEARVRMIDPTVAGMAEEGMPYRGVLYAGLMLTPTGPRLVEYNARFGDPECQVLMLRLKSDLVPLLYAAARGELSTAEIPQWHNEAAICVVLAAKGYPEAPGTGSIIRGADQSFGEGVQVFHAGTVLDGGALKSAGGRVLNVCARGATLGQARERAYAAVDKIDWPGGFHRRDIGWRALG